MTDLNPSATLRDITLRRRWRTALLGALAFTLAFGGLLSANPASAVELPPFPVSVNRIAGADRYEVAVNISKEAHQLGSYTAFIAAGTNYPDALSAGPLAAFYNAPLLLTQPGSLPASVKEELVRLGTKQVTIIGGPNSVSPAVAAEIAALPTAPGVNRIAGADRFEVSRNVLAYAGFSTSASMVYAATGTNFPDALSAGPAAVVNTAPVLLVNGPAAALDQPTRSLLQAIRPQTVRIAGGPASVSPAVETAIQQLEIPTVRYGGADRYQASQAINDVFTQSDRVFLATGANFPDALAGGAWAGREDGPLYVVPFDCVPQPVLDKIASLGANQVTLLGGTASLSPAVQELTPCAE